MPSTPSPTHIIRDGERIELSSEELLEREERRAEAKVRQVNLAAHFYLFLYVMVFFAAIYIHQRHLTCVKSYISYSLLLLFCVTTWAIYI